MSRLLVSAQLSLIALIAFPFQAAQLSVLTVGLFAVGMMVAVAAITVMPSRSFSVMPEPTSEGELVTRGIYRQLRHPMYLAVLLCGLAACLAYASAVKWGLLALLAGVLIAKIRREERLLLARFEGYAAYRLRTKALIPYLI
jgi:protein-S-isoprenylcysteine O-methyltransferase Ste14